MAILSFPTRPEAHYDDTLPDYVRRLNPPQREAVLACDGPVLILAGAGTGKTRVLTTRIAHLIATKRCWPSQILAVTFTNKASREMIERVQKLLAAPHSDNNSSAHGESTQGMWLGTFHSIAARILRRHAELVGLTSSFTILDTDDQLRLLKSVIAEKNLDDKRFPPKQILGMIQAWKDRGLTPDKVGAAYFEQAGAEMAQSLYVTYQKRLVANNATDFGDLLLHNLTLFQKHPEILREYCQKFKYILVDEYQDTNVGQYLWLRLLAMEHQNICCVGDDDQSIYGWRGAEVGNILKFETDYPNAALIRLEQNYRSTTPILQAASGLIAHNKGRLGKTLWTSVEGGDPIRIKAVWDDMEEARYVGEEIEAQQRQKIALADMAVLVRAGFQTRAFEERFLTLGIAYRVVGGLRFYERLEIRDAVAYLRAIHQPRDDLAFERIVNTPKRGIGGSTLEHLHTYARDHNCSLQEAVIALLAQGSIRGKAQSSLTKFMEQLQRWRSQAKDLGPGALCDIALEDSGYLAMWMAEKTPEAQGRLENLRELARALGEFASLEAFLEHISLVMDTEDRHTSDMISIMTLHAAKGLEFNTVFLAGWEEGLFPHQRALDESGNTGLEEERRLAYVGITRAKKHVYITHASSRRIYNQWQSSLPSRFLQELPAEHTEIVDGASQARGPAMFQRQIEQIMHEAQRVPSPVHSLSQWKGKRVFHTKFGYGVVLAETNGNLDIFFDKAGRKKVMADYVEMAKA
ncbi:MAG: UvrD-helicase domain-containing protein [Rickettsiales bacterium]|nr:UvrD-helicase domain-containing protein [Rickettsiales bacterium]